MSASQDHTCAVLSTRTVRCWGAGDYGQLGYGNSNTIGDDETPASVGDVNVGGDVLQVATGRHHTCALLTTGAVRCWGANTAGQLGYANTRTIGDDEAPASAGDVNVGGTVIALSAGGEHTCALLSTGRVRCWGSSQFGQLGYANTNSIGDDESPASAGDVNVGGRVLQISSGSKNTCALLDTGKVRCWGLARGGALGYGNLENIGDDETPAQAGDVDVGGDVVQITTGGNSTCALLTGGAVRCWGLNYRAGGVTAESSSGPNLYIGDDELPSSAAEVNLGGRAIQVVAGIAPEGAYSSGREGTAALVEQITSRMCAVLENGNVRCWGYVPVSPLGYGTMNAGSADWTSFDGVAARGDIDVGARVTRVTVGPLHACALLSSGAVRCWGGLAFSGSGLLGYGNTKAIGDDEAPASAGDVPLTTAPRGL